MDLVHCKAVSRYIHASNFHQYPYREFPLLFPQSLDRPLVRVDRVELVSENPIHHFDDSFGSDVYGFAKIRFIICMSAAKQPLLTTLIATRLSVSSYN